MGGVGIRGSVAKCGGILNYFMARVRDRERERKKNESIHKSWSYLERACAAVAAGLCGARMLHNLALLPRQSLGACAAILIRCGVLAGAAMLAGFMGAAVI